MSTGTKQKLLKGEVVSAKMQKSIVVQINYSIQDKRFKKTIRRSKKVAAHDEQNEAREGDIVIIKEGRPISRTKRHTLHSVVKRGVSSVPVAEGV